MSSERKIARCMNCGEEREMAAHGLCFRCYRASERAAENPWAAADRHNRAKLRAQKKLRTAVTAILNAVDGVIDLMEEEHVDAIRSVCGHYFAGLASGLPSIPSKTEDAVNSEHESCVNRSRPAEADNGVNSEHGSAQNCSQPSSRAGDSEHGHNDSASDAHAEMPVNSEQERSSNCSQEQAAISASSRIADSAEAQADGARIPRTEPNLPLIPSRTYSPRPHPRGGYGIYEHNSTVCVQWHATEEEAWEAITETVPMSEE